MHHIAQSQPDAQLLDTANTDWGRYTRRKSLAKANAKKQPSWPEPRRFAIEVAIGQVFGIKHRAIGNMSRGRASHAQARQVAMYLAHVACGMSLTDAGRLFERDRTTAAHACMLVEDKREDPVFDQALDLLEWVVPSIAKRPQNFLQMF